MLIEIILYLLVGYVDAQLLERVAGEVLEAEYVEEADRERLVARRPGETEQTIDLIDHPVEQSAVQPFRHRVPRRASLGDRIVSRDRLAPGHNRVRCQCLQKIALLHAEQLRDWNRDNIYTFDLYSLPLFSRGGELNESWNICGNFDFVDYIF